MKLKIKNPKLLSLILANAILLSQTGCVKNYENTAKTNAETVKMEEDTNLKHVEVVKEEIKKPEIEIKKCNNNVSSKKKIVIRKKNNKNSKLVMKVGKFQKLKEIGKTNNGWSLVKYKLKKGTAKGYVKSKNLAKLGDTYIEIDISDQKMTYYKDGKKFLSTPVTTGKDSTPTVTGLFDVYSKNRNYTMRGADYTSFSEYVLKFYKAYYIHDASWRYEYGGDIYHNNGSHGCVNTPYKKVKKLYNNVELKTKVLVHK